MSRAQIWGFVVPYQSFVSHPSEDTRWSIKTRPTEVVSQGEDGVERPVVACVVACAQVEALSYRTAPFVLRLVERGERRTEVVRGWTERTQTILGRRDARRGRHAQQWTPLDTTH